MRCFGKSSPASLFSSSALLVINPSQQSQHLSNMNKIFVYTQLSQGRTVGDQVRAQKFSLNDPDSLKSAAAFPAARPQVVTSAGGFQYPASTADTIHWTANFADSRLFGFCEGPLLAQDELQVLEHPALAHIKSALPSDLKTLSGYDAALFQNVPRLGSLDTTTPFPDGHTLYGNRFAAATHDQILARLQLLNPPTSSNIFAIAAPHVPFGMANQPYQKKDIDALFFTAYNAFHAIKESSPGKKVVAHTGNWGAGAFGNDLKTVHLLQLAAARFAGIDEIRMHPMSSQAELQAARQLLDQIERQFPQMTIGQFIDHLTANAASYQLTYKTGNGT